MISRQNQITGVNNMTYYKLEGEIKWNHNEEILSMTLGITVNRAMEVINTIMQYSCNKEVKISEILEKILDNNELSLAEKIYGIFMLGYHIDFFALINCFRYFQEQRQREGMKQ